MMKTLLLSLFMMITLSSYAQMDVTPKIEYPSYYVNNNGDTLGILISVEQAQKVDNDLELLGLLKNMKFKSDSALSSYIIVVDKYENRIAILDAKISTLDSINSDRKEMINNLNKQIFNFKSQIDIADNQIRLNNDIIKNKDKRIRRLQVQKIFGFIGSGAFFVASAILLGLSSK